MGRRLAAREPVLVFACAPSLLLALALASTARAEVVFDAPFLSTAGAEAPSGLGAGDLNGDGRVDLVSSAWYPGSHELVINLGLGDGRFAAPVEYDCGSEPRAVAVGDVNGDGKLDVVTANADGSVSLLLGNGDGTVGEHAEYALASPISGGQIVIVRVADLDGDGRSDVIVTNPSQAMLSIFPGDADGTIGPRRDVTLAFSARFALVVGQFTGDTKPDLLVSGNGQYFVLPGNGDFTFGSALPVAVGLSASYSALSATAGDLNADGKPDLVFRESVSSSGSLAPRVGVCLGNGDGTFSTASHWLTQSGVGLGLVEIGDFDGDGKPDVALIQAQNGGGGTVSLLRGHGSSAFDDAREFAAVNVPVGSAVADVNGDGRADLMLAGRFGSCVGVLLGNAAGGFGTPHELLVGTGPRGPIAPLGLAIGDIDHDGALDVATISGFPDSLDVLLGDGDGGFPTLIRTPADTIDSYDLALADFDGDGTVDLAVVSQRLPSGDSDSTVSVRHGNGDGTFGPPVRWFAGLGPYNLHVADMNEDGHPDLAVLYGATAVTPGSPPHAVAVLLNNGNGTFQPPRSYEIGANTVGIAVGDLNHDGHPDIVASSNGLNSVVTLLGNGDGTFTSGPSRALSRPGLPALADLNEDGILDLAIEHGNNGGLDDSVAVMLGAGNGAFAPHVEWSLIGANDVAGFADFDHDGHLDLALETSGRSLSVWSGHGDGSFSPPATDFGLGSNASYLVIADFNGDQLPDVIAGNEDMDDLQLLLNRTVTPPAAVLDPPSPRLSLSLGIAPVPSRGDRLLVAFTLPGRERARLELFDVVGRRIVSHDVTALGAGLHRIDLAAGRAFRPGVYLLRLTQAGRAVTARAVVVE